MHVMYNEEVSVLHNQALNSANPNTATASISAQVQGTTCGQWQHALTRRVTCEESSSSAEVDIAQDIASQTKRPHTRASVLELE